MYGRANLVFPVVLHFLGGCLAGQGLSSKYLDNDFKVLKLVCDATDFAVTEQISNMTIYRNDTKEVLLTIKPGSCPTVGNYSGAVNFYLPFCWPGITAPPSKLQVIMDNYNSSNDQAFGCQVVRLVRFVGRLGKSVYDTTTWSIVVNKGDKVTAKKTSMSSTVWKPTTRLETVYERTRHAYTSTTSLKARHAYISTTSLKARHAYTSTTSLKAVYKTTEPVTAKNTTMPTTTLKPTTRLETVYKTTDSDSDWKALSVEESTKSTVVNMCNNSTETNGVTDKQNTEISTVSVEKSSESTDLNLKDCVTQTSTVPFQESKKNTVVNPKDQDVWLICASSNPVTYILASGMALLTLTLLTLIYHFRALTLRADIADQVNRSRRYRSRNSCVLSKFKRSEENSRDKRVLHPESFYISVANPPRSELDAFHVKYKIGATNGTQSSTSTTSSSLL